MLEHERKKTILRLLDLRSFANIHDVVETTGASEATIRRDFHEMEKEKLVRRVRGGVELVRPRGLGVSRPCWSPRWITVSASTRRRSGGSRARPAAPSATGTPS